MFENFTTLTSFVEFSHSLPNSQISMISSLGSVAWENKTPSIVSIDQSYLGNGSTTTIWMETSICGSFDLIYIIGQNGNSSEGSLSVVNSSFAVTMPVGNQPSEQMQVTTSDCLGNSKVEAVELTRDLTPPTLGYSGHISMRISDTTEILISANDDSGIKSKTISFTYGNDSQQLCLNLTSECYVTIGDYFTLQHNTTITMDFNLVTNSGQTLSQTRDTLVDTEVGNWWIDYDESSNIFGTFVSGQTNIEFHFEERMSNFCVNHSNPDVNQGC